MNGETPGAAQACLAAIVESSDDAILSKNLDGIIQSCNGAGERIFGYTAGELVGKPVRILIPPERQAEEDEILARIRRGERVDHFETVRLRKDGRRIDISLTVSPVRDATGSILGASKIAREIGEQKRIRAAESYLAASNPQRTRSSRRISTASSSRATPERRNYSGTRLRNWSANRFAY